MFEVDNFFHVKRNLNRMVDSLIEKGVSLDQRMMAQDDRIFVLNPIPWKFYLKNDNTSSKYSN